MRPAWSKAYRELKGSNLNDDVTDGDPQPHCAGGDASTTEDDYRYNNQSPKVPYKRSIITYMVVSSFSLIIMLALSIRTINVLTKHSYINHEQSEPAHQLTRVCGDTAAEAKALGCTFDHLTWSWLSPSCPRYAADEFEAADDFKYFSDPVKQIVVSDEDWEKAINNEIPLYTERREHVSHCVYTFLSLAQILRDGTRTHPKLSTYEHIEHCAEVVMESLKRDKDWNRLDADMGDVSFDEGC